MKKHIILSSYLFVFCFLLGAQSWNFPQPTGKYQVGATKLVLEDCSRKELLSADQGCRRIAVTIWYPAQVDDKAEPLYFLNEYDIDRIAPFFGMHGVLLSKFRSGVQQIKTNSFENAPLYKSIEKLPVLLFSPGYALSLPELHTSFAEEAASRGYVVLTINHPFESMATKFSEDETVFLNVVNRQKIVGTLFAQVGKLASLADLPTNTEKKEVLKEVMRSLPEMNSRLDEWVADSQLTLDILSEYNQDEASIWFNKFDLDKIGAIGHSFGGVTAVQLVATDKRVKSAINLDGLQLGNVVNTVLERPVMMVSSKVYQGLSDPIFNGSKGPVFLVHPGDKMTYHNIFTDMALWPDDYFTNRAKDIGEIEGKEFVRMTNELVFSFFDQSLNGDIIDLSSVVTKYDQLQLIED